MKITFMVNQYARISGGNRALFEYANRLLEKGCEVRWFVMPPRVKWTRPLQKLRTFFDEPTVEPAEKVDWLANKLPIEILPRKSDKWIPSADIFIATAWQTAEFAKNLPPEKGSKFYFVQHHESLWGRYKNQAAQTYRLPFKKIVISTWLKEEMKSHYGQSADVLVTPVNREVFQGTTARNNPGARVLMLHHDYDWKGFADGIAAFGQTRSENPSAQLVVFGEKLKDPAPLFRDAGFEFEYHYRPTQSDLRDLYSSADIYLCPSWHEGLGMPPMEAMACGSALVTTDTGGSWDYAIHNETALVSPPQDPGSLAKNLITLLQDDGLRKRLAENGKKKIEQLDWDANCDRLLNILKENS